MAKLYAGLDVGDQTTAICVLDGKGVKYLETSVATAPSALYAALKPYRPVLQCVGLESGTKSGWLYRELGRKRLPLVCLDARHAHAALSASRNKTDKADAYGLAILLARGLFTRAYVKSPEALRIRMLLNVRKALQRKAIDLQTCMRMSEKSMGGIAERKGRRLVVKHAKRSDSLQRDLSQLLLRCSTSLFHEVARLDKLVIKAANADPVCRLFMTVPGVGPITALSYRAGVDDPRRFKRARSVAAYFGLTPRRYQSGQTDVQGHISRMGDVAVRSALYSAARALMRATTTKWWVRTWALGLARRKGTRRAAVACARMLAVVLHRMWMTGKDFASFTQTA